MLLVLSEFMKNSHITWWRQQMESFPVLLVICAGNSPVTGEFPSQRPVTRIFDIFFDLRLNKLLSKQSWGMWFETPLRPIWRHCNDSGSLHWLWGIYHVIALVQVNNTGHMIMYPTATTHINAPKSCYVGALPTGLRHHDGCRCPGAI